MKGLLSIISALCLVFASAAATQIAAAESPLSSAYTATAADYTVTAEGDAEQVLPAVYASSTTTRQGDYAYVNIEAENFIAVGSLEVFVYYDTTALTFNSSYENGLNSGNICEVNDSGGVINLSTLSLDGMEGSGSLWRLTFRVADDAVVGDYNINVAVGEVYSTALEPVSVSARGGKITVTERPAAINNIYVYSSTGVAVHEGEQTEVKFYTYNAYGLAAADFEIEYDPARLELNEVALGNSLLQAEGAIWSANTDTAGYIKISYINLKGISGAADPLVTCSFTVIGNAEQSVPVSLKLGGMYDADQNAIKSDGATANISTLYTPPVITYPSVHIGGYTGTDGQFEVQVVAEGATGLAAGDFVVSYDSAVLECVSVEKSVAENIVVVNPNFAEGEVRFSFISEDGISADMAMVTITFAPLISSGETQLNVSGNNLVDAEFNAVTVEYVPSTIVITGHAWGEWEQTKAPTCTEAGEEQRVCANDPLHVVTREIAALGHDLVHHEAKAPTCTEIGWEAYDTCSRCDYTTYKEISTTGHAESEPVRENEVAATCTTDGKYDEVIYCSVCGEELSYETVTVKATGHAWGEWTQVKAPTYTEIGEEMRTCAVCGMTETKPIAALGIVQKFKDEVVAIEVAQSRPERFSAISTALTTYDTLSDEEKIVVSSDYAILDAAISAYNASANTANEELNDAMELAVKVLSSAVVVATVLAGAWFVLKRLF